MLFNAKFEAWEYGPVVREVFDERNDDKYFSEGKITIEEYIKRMSEVSSRH